MENLPETLSIWSMSERAYRDYTTYIDGNNEVVAEYNDDFLKFPGGLTVEALQGLVDTENANRRQQFPPEEDDEE